DLASVTYSRHRGFHRRRIHHIPAQRQPGANPRRDREKIPLEQFVRLAIIGGGSWGTALAIVLAPRFDEIRLWVFESDLAERISRTRENDVFLPGFSLGNNIAITSELRAATAGAEVVLGVMPSRYGRGIYTQLATYVGRSATVVSATKGLEQGTL